MGLYLCRLVKSFFYNVLTNMKFNSMKWVIPEKIHIPPDGWGRFLTPPLTWIS